MKSFGYEGIDVCVRPGHPVHFGNVTTALPEAVAASALLEAPAAVPPAPAALPSWWQNEADRFLDAAASVALPKPLQLAAAEERP